MRADASALLCRWMRVSGSSQPTPVMIKAVFSRRAASSAASDGGPALRAWASGPARSSPRAQRALMAEASSRSGSSVRVMMSSARGRRLRCHHHGSACDASGWLAGLDVTMIVLRPGRRLIAVNAQADAKRGAPQCRKLFASRRQRRNRGFAIPRLEAKATHLAVTTRAQLSMFRSGCFAAFGPKGRTAVEGRQCEFDALTSLRGVGGSTADCCPRGGGLVWLAPAARRAAHTWPGQKQATTVAVLGQRWPCHRLTTTLFLMLSLLFSKLAPTIHVCAGYGYAAVVAAT
jgi:hypothetical protein